jgi:hypothetical protein
MEGMFSGCSELTSIPQLDTLGVTELSDFLNGCTSLTTIPQLDTSFARKMDGMFKNCSSLTTIPRLNTMNVESMSDAFIGCYNLQHLGGFRSLRASIGLFWSPLLTHESLMNVINNLDDVNDIDGYRYLVLSETNLAKLTDDEIAIATGKGWILD